MRSIRFDRNLFGIPAQEQLGAALIEQSGMDNVFFSNSGAEANEAAIKLARLHGHKQEIENPAIIVMDNSFQTPMKSNTLTIPTLTANGAAYTVAEASSANSAVRNTAISRKRDGSAAQNVMKPSQRNSRKYSDASTARSATAVKRRAKKGSSSSEDAESNSFTRILSGR